jgi:hypothetical protein
MTPNGLPLNRRQFLALSATAVGGTALLAACGGGSGATGAAGDITVVQRFPNTGLVPGNLRLPISLANQKGILDDAATKDFATVTVDIIDVVTGKTVVPGITVKKHGEGLALPYWPVEVTIDKVGTYSIVVNGASKDGGAFQVMDPANVEVPVTGQKMLPFDTPTVDNARGVDPICTLPAGTCPFHKVTLTDALKSGKPVVYLIGTPAHCQTGTCGPALEALVAAAENLGDKVEIIHAEVYTDKAATKIAPAVQAYRLDFEPVLYAADRTGRIVKRLDGVFDVNEVRDTVASLL